MLSEWPKVLVTCAFRTVRFLLPFCARGGFSFEDCIDLIISSSFSSAFIFPSCSELHSASSACIWCWPHRMAGSQSNLLFQYCHVEPAWMSRNTKVCQRQCIRPRLLAAPCTLCFLRRERKCPQRWTPAFAKADCIPSKWFTGIPPRLLEPLWRCFNLKNIEKKLSALSNTFLRTILSKLTHPEDARP